MNKRSIRFGVFTLFFLMACVAGLLSGYRIGFESGQARWESYPAYTKVYAASFLLERSDHAEEELQELVTQIRTDILPLTWEESGGKGVIKAQTENLSLVVSGNQIVHDELSRYLVAMREDQATSPMN